MPDSHDILSKLGKRIKNIRQSKGMTQEALADACGLDRTYISGIERGKRNVAVLNLELVAASLGISLAKLFEDIEDKDFEHRNT